MKSSHSPDAVSRLALSLLLASPATSMLHCDKVIASGRKFDFSKLGGPHSVTVSRSQGPIATNTTFTTDLCRPLRRKGDVPTTQQCPNGSRVCAIVRSKENGSDNAAAQFSDVWPIAGELADRGGKHLDLESINLSTSDSNEDSKKQGVRLIMKGGFHIDRDTNLKTDQWAIVEMVCAPFLEGTEGEWDPEDKYEPGDDPLKMRLVPTDPWLHASAADGKDGDISAGNPVQVGTGNASLVFESYGPLDGNRNIDVLRLTWKTKYACEDAAEVGGDRNSHWGFFTWIVILVFLGTASYLIFGSWLNYNRYGARGWDLLPHGDTIRDVPYLMKDWTRRVLNTMQGSGGNRGGYSAV